MINQSEHSAEAIDRLRPNAIFNINKDGLEWLDDTQTRPTDEEIMAEVAKIELEIPARKARRQRDRLISRTDWWASSDIVMTEEQKAYRQALRDITNQEGFPSNIVWPTEP